MPNNLPAPPNLSPFDIASFRVRRTQIKDAYRHGRSKLDFDRGQLNTGYARNFTDLTRKFTQNRNSFAGGYAKRGLMNSGIYGQGLQNFYTDRDNAFGNLNFSHQQALGQNTQQGLDLAAGKRQGMASINADRLARRAMVATTLRSSGL